MDLSRAGLRPALPPHVTRTPTTPMLRLLLAALVLTAVAFVPVMFCLLIWITLP